MRAEHDWCLLGRGDGGHLNVPLVWGQSVGHISNDFSRKTFHAIWVDQREGDGAIGVSNNCPVAPIPRRRSQQQVMYLCEPCSPSIWTSVQGVFAIVLVWQDVVSGTVNLESRILDTVGVAACGCQTAFSDELHVSYLVHRPSEGGACRHCSSLRCQSRERYLFQRHVCR